MCDKNDGNQEAPCTFKLFCGHADRKCEENGEIWWRSCNKTHKVYQIPIKPARTVERDATCTIWCGECGCDADHPDHKLTDRCVFEGS